MGFNRVVLTKWLKDAGFCEISISCVGCSCCSDFVKTTDKADISIVTAYGVK